MRCRAAFSIVEAMVAAMVFAIAAVGVFSTISSSQKPSVSSDNSLQAAYIGQQILENMHSNVDASTWADSASPLYGTTSGTAHVCPTVTPPLPSGWTCNYTVTEDAVSKARQVVLNITWPGN